MKNGFFISLDFELFWGVFDNIKYTIKDERFSRTKEEVIPRLLNLFEFYDISCTWAIVGFLFAKDKHELQSYFPTLLPQYNNVKLSPYRYIQQIQDNLEVGIAFAGDSIQLIKETTKQEIATHTFCHYYCLEKGQTREQFDLDIKAAKRIAKDNYNLEIESIVFPRNQINYLDVLIENQILNYRGCRSDSIYKGDSFNNKKKLHNRILRLIDRYINISGYGNFDINQIQNSDLLVNNIASRFLAPCARGFVYLDAFRLNRIKQEMALAAEKKLSYHLWWHPHNFGMQVEENFLFLEEILKFYKELNSLYGFQSFKMKDAVL